ncbi:hypothetical protein BH10ACI1_BH10ACI1_26090 [soil metagenome]
MHDTLQAKIMNKLIRIIFGLVIVFGFGQVVFGATYNVTNDNDMNDGICDNSCSLREAIAAANATPDNDVIRFSPLFNFPKTIILNGTDIIITNNGTLVIEGPGNDKLTVSGNNASRVFTNNTGAVATINNLRVTGGNGVSTVSTGRGGGIYNSGGVLSLNNLILTGNMTSNGGALNNAGTATLNINNCAIFNNSSTGAGGALQNFSGNTTNISNSSIYGNVSNSNITGGGAMQANGTVNITNTTIANNTATSGSGGGIYFNGTALNITNSTIAGNIATLNGGGIHKSTSNPGVVRNTIIANNNGDAASPDATGIFISEGNNIIGNVGTATGWIMSDQQNVNPVLSPLGFYGGTGLSFALLTTSPALDAGQNCVTNLTCATNNPLIALTTDQRGAARPFNSTVDIGAFESSTTYIAAMPRARNQYFYSVDIAPNVGMSSYSLTAGTLPTGISFATITTVATVSGTPLQTGIFEFTITVNTSGNTTAVKYALTVFSEAANASISGRVLRADGSPLSGVAVSVTDRYGIVRRTLSSSFGYYSFDQLNISETYQIQVNSKTYTFNPGTINYTVIDTANNVNFTANP